MAIKVGELRALLSKYNSNDEVYIYDKYEETFLNIIEIIEPVEDNCVYLSIDSTEG